MDQLVGSILSIDITESSSIRMNEQYLSRRRPSCHACYCNQHAVSRSENVNTNFCTTQQNFACLFTQIRRYIIQDEEAKGFKISKSQAF
ncbi:unnamed protein product [Onchocerca flexuosa]|uniref:Uncharacterized protein n=1 Tax=Onchocerca flexuosa TaxID=387005 RepID=A0A183HMU2_9BILA|nr:unnamed protein product [Onchocerca flexuosa]